MTPAHTAPLVGSPSLHTSTGSVDVADQTRLLPPGARSQAVALTRVSLLCTLRRTVRTATGTPLLALVVALALLALPAFAAWLGHRAGGALPSVLPFDMALPVTSSLSLAAAAIGASLAAVAPSIAQVDPSVRTAPVRGSVLVCSTVLAPMLLLLGYLGLILAATAAAAAIASPAPMVWLIVPATLIVSVAAGAAATETSRLALSRAPRSALLVPVVLLPWVVLGLLGNPYGGAAGLLRGPAAASAGLLDAATAFGPGQASTATPTAIRSTLLGVALVSAGAAWVACWLLASAARTARASQPLLIGTVRFRDASTTALTRAFVALLLRQRPVAMQCAVTVVVAGLTAAFLSPTGGGQTGVLFGAALAVAGSTVLPLAAPGLPADGLWLWRTASVPLARVCRAAMLAGTVGQALALSVGLAPLVALSLLPASSLVLIVGLAAALGAVALLAGCVAPWRATSAGDQAVSLTVLVGLGLAVWGPIGFVLNKVVDAGANEQLLGIAVPAVLYLLALLVLPGPQAKRLEGRGRADSRRRADGTAPRGVHRARRLTDSSCARAVQQ